MGWVGLVGLVPILILSSLITGAPRLVADPTPERRIPTTGGRFMSCGEKAASMHGSSMASSAIPSGDWGLGGGASCAGVLGGLGGGGVLERVGLGVWWLKPKQPGPSGVSMRVWVFLGVPRDRNSSLATGFGLLPKARD